MAYFGWPEAYDNDGELAVRAALAMLDAVVKLNKDSTTPELAARVGIDSGAVVVGAGAAKEPDVFGGYTEYRGTAASNCCARYGNHNCGNPSFDIRIVRSRSTRTARA